MTRNQLQFYANAETARANLAKEAQAANELAETRRSNVIREEETERHNRRSEQLDKYASDVKKYAAETKLVGDMYRSTMKAIF